MVAHNTVATLTEDIPLNTDVFKNMTYLSFMYNLPEVNLKPFAKLNDQSVSENSTMPRDCCLNPQIIIIIILRV